MFISNLSVYFACLADEIGISTISLQSGFDRSINRTYRLLHGHHLIKKCPDKLKTLRTSSCKISFMFNSIEKEHRIKKTNLINIPET